MTTTGGGTTVELEARSAFLELLAGFVGALAVGVAASFASDHAIKRWLIALLFTSGCALWVAVSLLSFLTYRRVRALRGGTAAPRRRLSTEWPGWITTIFMGTTSVFVLAGLVFWLGMRSDDFSSSYDGQDPKLTHCWDPASKVVWGDDGRLALLDLDGKAVGHIELEASPACGTIWAVLLVDKGARSRLQGQIVHIQMDRDADGDSEPYALRLHGGALGWSNMISAVETCARAKVYMVKGLKHGPTQTTDCELEEL